MRNILTLLCIGVLFIPSLLQAQSATIKGTISDAANGELLVGVNVILDKTGGSATDLDGNYILKTTAGEHKLDFKYVGYSSVSKTVTLTEGQVLVLDMKLGDVMEELDIVVVSASKYEKKLSEETVSMEVLGGDLIENSNSVDMEDAVQKVPGVTVTEGQANIRGGAGWSYGAGSRVLVVVDNLPLLTADAGDAKWSFVPTENIEQVEVIKGAASALYGSSALNGIINVRTSWPGNEPVTKVKVHHSWLGKPNSKEMAWWAEGDEDKVIDWRTPEGFETSDTNYATAIYDNGTEEIVDLDALTKEEYVDFIQSDQNSGSTVRALEKRQNKEIKWFGNQPLNASLSILHKRKIKQFDLVLSSYYYGQKSHLYGGNTQDVRVTMKTRFRPKNIEGLSTGIAINYFRSKSSVFFLWDGPNERQTMPLPNTISNSSNLRATVDPFVTYYDKKQNKYSFNGRYFNAKNTNDTEQGSKPELFYGEFQFQRYFTPINMNIVAGIAADYKKITSPTGDPESSLVGEHDGSNIGIYIQMDKKFGDRFSIAAGLRAERFKVDDLESDEEIPIFTKMFGRDENDPVTSPIKPVGRLGLNFQAAEHSYLRASIGQGYRFPSIAELFVQTNVGGIGIYSNRNLESETGWSGEVAFKQGIKISKWLGYADLALFINKYQNMMEFTFGTFGTSQDPLFGLGFSSQNVGNTRILGTELTLVGKGEIAGYPTTVLMGYTFIDPFSENWNDTLVLIDSRGNEKPGTTYAETSTSSDNFLKYRSAHLFKADIETTIGKIRVGVSVQYQSFMKNIDQIFVSDLLIGQETPDGLNTNGFSALRSWREREKGYTLLDARISYDITEKSKVAFLVKNILNQEYTIRPALHGAPISYEVMATYEF